jgi:ABC-type antimicrobial peptide transport system permease subunit
MGIYGVVAFTVEQRTREIGVRIALGASGNAIVRHMMRGGLELIGAATFLGLLASAAIGRLLTTFISGSLAAHVVTALIVGIFFACIAMLACYVPARRAAALDPLKALRAD